ncbi:MAG: MmcB family DNA repair protein [Melioribacteraceae bacterium]|nr:MmcB family DNA repair protein [Melioribacteraceae bacterium]
MKDSTPNKITAADIKLSLTSRHTNDFYLTEVKTGSTWFSTFHRIDAMAMAKSWKNPKVTIYEVKVDRNDFLRDNKCHNYYPFCHEFYFACSPDLIQRDEIDAHAGLIYSTGKSNRIIKKALYRDQEIPSEIFQYIIMSRITEPPYPFFNNTKEYFEAWLERKKSCHELSVKVKSEIINRLAELEDSKERYENIQREIDKLREVIKTYGVNYYGYDLAGALKRLLKDQQIVSFNPIWFMRKLKETIDNLSEIKDNLIKTSAIKIEEPTDVEG